MARIHYDLKGTAALVTGGASGIGLATVRMLAEAGCRVAINHLADDPRGPEQVAALTAEGFSVLSAPGNVADAADAPRMVEAAVAAASQKGQRDAVTASVDDVAIGAQPTKVQPATARGVEQLGANVGEAKGRAHVVTGAQVRWHAQVREVFFDLLAPRHRTPA